MRKTLLVTVLLLLLSAGWLVAQQTSPDQSSAAQSSADQANQKAVSDKDSQKTILQGCLDQSADNFLLTDDKGNTYQLSGEKSELSKHVGQQVEIKGSISKSSAASSSEKPENEKGASAAASQLLKVSSIKKLADSCASPQAPPK